MTKHLHVEWPDDIRLRILETSSNINAESGDARASPGWLALVDYEYMPLIFAVGIGRGEMPQNAINAAYREAYVGATERLAARAADSARKTIALEDLDL